MNNCQPFQRLNSKGKDCVIKETLLPGVDVHIALKFYEFSPNVINCQIGMSWTSQSTGCNQYVHVAVALVYIINVTCLEKASPMYPPSATQSTCSAHT